MKRSYEILADYHQFYLLDRKARPDAPETYTQADVEARIKAAPHIVVIQPERDMTVPVTLEVLDGRPSDDDFGRWDHVAEASLDLPSGELAVDGWSARAVDRLRLQPGAYRVRACFAGLATLSADGLDGDDSYALFLWPEPPAPVAVLKQYHPS